MVEKSLLYGLNERPPLGALILYGVQWLMITIPNVVVPGALCAAALGMDAAGQVSFTQRLLLATGFLTTIQTLAGHRYPLLEGPSTAALLSFLVLAPLGLAAIEGGLLAGGLILVVVGACRWYRWLGKVFTPNVVGVILVLVALTLLPVLYPLLIGMDPGHPHGEAAAAARSLALILFVAWFAERAPGPLKTLAMLAGIILGFILAALKGELALAAISQAPWFHLPVPFLGVRPAFSLPAILTFAITYGAIMLNSVGSIQGIAEIVGKDGLPARTNRGIAFTGAGGLVAGSLGVVGLVSYSLGPGVVLVTRVGSRIVLTAGGLLMVAAAFVPKALALLSAIPPGVIAAVLLAVLSPQVVAGVNIMLAGRGRFERREYFTVGLPILLGTTAALLPKAFFSLLPGTLAPLASNGLVVGILFALVLEHVIFRAREAHQDTPEQG